jgi:hypothetical protein
VLTAANLVYFLAYDSPACVVGALPSRLALRAFSIVFFSGISGFPPYLTEVFICSRGRDSFVLNVSRM